MGRVPQLHEAVSQHGGGIWQGISMEARIHWAAIDE